MTSVPKLPAAVAVYARISLDSEGTGLGVARQLEDCRRLADQLGWTVAEEYVDNDVSAYDPRKVRPEYRRMLADLAEGTRDAVLAYHADRLHRRPLELEQFLETVTAAGVRHVRFVSGGEIDLSNGDGLMVLRILSSVAAGESATKSRRVRRKMDERAAAGLPQGGTRPFGYEADKVTVNEAEADTVQRLTARFIAGESLRSLAAWLDEHNITTVQGNRWTTTAVRNVLTSPRYAGLREHRGKVVGPAVWEAIISAEDHQRIMAIFESRKTTGRRTPRRYLLSGLLVCGRCGNRLYSSARADTKRRRYVCMSGPDHGGCGHLTVVAEPVEDLLRDAVLYRLDTPELAEALSGAQQADAETAAIADALAADRQRFDDLADMYAAGNVTMNEWMRARPPIQDRIRNAERILARRSSHGALTNLVGDGAALRDRWADLSLSRQASIVAAVLNHAVIAPGVSGARQLDPGRVEPVWRL